MGNCIKTKLSKSINSSSLPVIGSIRFGIYQVSDITSNKVHRIAMPNNYKATVDAKIIGNGSVTVVNNSDSSVVATYSGDGTVFQVGYLQDIIASNDNFYIDFLNVKYDNKLRIGISGNSTIRTNVTSVECGISFDMSQVNYATAILQYFSIQGWKLYGELKMPAYWSCITNYSGNGYNNSLYSELDINTNIFNGITDQGYFVFNCANALPAKSTRIINLNDFNGCTGFTQIGIQNISSATGSVNDFIAGQIAAGRTSGTVLLQLYNSSVTINGVDIKETQFNVGFLRVTFSSSFTKGFKFESSSNASTWTDYTDYIVIN